MYNSNFIKSGILIFSIFFGVTASATECKRVLSVSCNENCQKLKEEFRYIVYMGQKIYVHRSQKQAETGIDYEALAKEIEESITDATDYTSYSRLMQKWAASFYDGHVNYFHKSNPLDLIIYETPLKFEILAAATDHEQVVVANNIRRHNISRGDQLLAVNGDKIEDFIRREKEYISGSTEIQRRLRVVRQLLITYGHREGQKPLTLTFERNGQIREVTVKRRQIDIENYQKESKENLEVRTLPGSIAYINVRTFADRQLRQALVEAFEKIDGTKGLLLDLRENTGGASIVSDVIAGYLSSERMVRFYADFRRTKEATPWMDDWLEDLGSSPDGEFTDKNRHYNLVDRSIFENSKLRGKTYGKPVVILIGPQCFSACDVFLHLVREHKLATLVGEPTSGGAGGDGRIELAHSGASFRYAVARKYTSVRQAPIEGISVVPDILIERTSEDIRNGTDSQLKEAVNILKQQSRVLRTKK